MNLMNIAVIFQTPPYGRSHGREGLDALLATGAFTEDIGVFFVGEGVYQLLKNQDPSNILCRNHSKTFGLLEMYDLTQVFVVEEDLQQRHLTIGDLIIPVNLISTDKFGQMIHSATNKMVF